MPKTLNLKTLDSGAAYTAIPGNTGAMTRDGEQLDDTIFGQNFRSSQPGLINWGATANAFYKGFAGYVADIKKSGTSTAFTAEAMTEIGSSGENKFRISDASKDVWDRTVTPTFYDVTSSPAVAIPVGEITSIDYLFGIVIFNTPQTGPVTVDGNYLPMADFGKANAFTLTQTAETLDTTDLATAQSNNGFNTFVSTLLTAALELSSFFDVTNGLHDLLVGRSEFVIEINPDGNIKSVARGFFKCVSDNVTGDVGGNEVESATFNLSVPEGLDTGIAPFSWLHASDTTLSQALQDALTAWVDQVELVFQYLPDGTVGSGSGGYEGNVLVTEVSLAGGVNVMNEFSLTLQGTGELGIAS